MSLLLVLMSHLGSAAPLDIPVERLGVVLHVEDDKFGHPVRAIRDDLMPATDYTETIEGLNDAIASFTKGCIDNGARGVYDRIRRCQKIGFRPLAARAVPADQIGGKDQRLYLLLKGQVDQAPGELILYVPLQTLIKKRRKNQWAYWSVNNGNVRATPPGTVEPGKVEALFGQP